MTVAVTSMSFVGRRMAGADASVAVSMAADDARFAILATRAVAANW